MRKAGAKRTLATLRSVLLLLPLALFANLLHAGNLQLLAARAAVVRESALTQTGAGAGAAPATLRLQVQAGLELHDLRLRPKTTLGALATRLQGQATAYGGQLADRPGSWVAVTRIGNRWSGMWFDGTRHYAIDSARALASVSRDAAAMAPDSLMVYRLEDVLLDNTSFEGDMKVPPKSAEQLAAAVGAELAAAGAADVLPTKRLVVNMLADPELATREGTQTETNMLARLNMVDGIVANQLGVQLQSGARTIFNSSNSPFTAATDAKVLIDEVAAYRTGPGQQPSSGLTHLWTGRDLDGNTVGIAFIGNLCDGKYSASLSEARRLLSNDALIAAHEIGHVFGAPHDGETDSACAATPGDAATAYLMAGQLSANSPNRDVFSACSLQQIAPVVARAQCLARADAPDAAVEVPRMVSIALNQPTDIVATVRSLGNVDATGVTLRVTLPATLTLQNASSPGGTCTSASINNVVDCTLGSIAAGASQVVTLRVLTATAGVTNATLRVTAVNDALHSNDNASIQLQAAEGTDLALALTADTTTVVVGNTATATFTMTNRGPVAVTDALLNVTIPPGLSVTQQTVEGLVCVAVTGGLTCGPVPMVTDATARLMLTLRADAAGAATLSGQASSSRPELQAANNNGQVVFTVNNPPAQGASTAGGGGSGGGGRASPWWLLCMAAMLGAALQRRDHWLRLRTQARAK